MQAAGYTGGHDFVTVYKLDFLTYPLPKSNFLSFCFRNNLYKCLHMKEFTVDKAIPHNDVVAIFAKEKSIPCWVWLGWEGKGWR